MTRLITRVHRLILGIALCGLSYGAAYAAPVSLDTWTTESYPAVSGFGAGQWQVAPDNASVTQTVNGQPTIFYSDFSAVNTDVTGQLDVSGGDDDLIGFVLGFEPGDASSGSADYLLIDWKGRTQSFNFTGPPGATVTPGSSALAGLAVSRISGLPTADEFWGHTDFAENALGGVTELARGMSLGSTGWAAGSSYDFRFVFTPTLLEVYVDDTLEVSLNGSFPSGRLGFYNFSQGNVRYSAFNSEVVPEPGSATLIGLGLMGLGFGRQRARDRNESV